MAPLLSTYLNDHLAGSIAALELAKRSAQSNRGSAYGRVLSEMAEEIAEDREALEEIMKRLDAGKDRAKTSLAWGMEKVGRLKPNGRLLGYSPLSRLEEMEALTLGVEGKLALWQALAESHRGDPRLRGVDLAQLQQRARSQAQRLEAQRRRAAVAALR